MGRNSERERYGVMIPVIEPSSVCQSSRKQPRETANSSSTHESISQATYEFGWLEGVWK